MAITWKDYQLSSTAFEGGIEFEVNRTSTASRDWFASVVICERVRLKGRRHVRATGSRDEAKAAAISLAREMIREAQDEAGVVLAMLGEASDGN